MSEQYFFVRKLGLGKEVVSLSLVVTAVTDILIVQDFMDISQTRAYYYYLGEVE